MPGVARGPLQPAGWTRRCLRGPVLACLLSATLPAMAGPPPDAGQLQRQAERTLAPAPAAPPPGAPPDGAASSADGPRFEVTGFQLDGVSLLPEGTLQAALAPWRGRPIGFADLQAALRRVVATYRAHGWFARADLPEQDITGGVVRIQVLEGRFGRLGVLDDGRRAHADFVARVASRGLRAGEPYSQATLERGLLLANDLPGIRAEGVLQAGQAPGTTDLILQVDDAPLVTGSVAIGNDGSRYTGRAQAMARAALDNPGGHGDQLAATFMRGADLEYGGASYTFPLGAGGLRGNLGYTAMDYSLGKEFQMLEARGTSRLRRAGLAYPLRRSEASNLELELAWAHRRQEDASLGEELRRRRLRDLALSLAGDALHANARGAQSAWILDIVRGRASLDLPADWLADAQGDGVHGRYTLARLELRHDRWLHPDWYLRARLNGQWSSRNLDSSQQFVLGGPGGVRGYPVNEAAGDSGAVLQLELHRLVAAPWGGELDGYLFADGGSIRQRQDPWDPWATNRYELAAAGLGLRWTHRTLAAGLAVGTPLGDNPGGLGGANQDGTRRAPQLWFNLRRRFP